MKKIKEVLLNVYLEIQYWTLFLVLWLTNRPVALLMWNNREVVKPIAKARAMELYQTKTKEERKKISKEAFDFLMRL